MHVCLIEDSNARSGLSRGLPSMSGHCAHCRTVTMANRMSRGEEDMTGEHYMV